MFPEMQRTHVPRTRQSKRTFMFATGYGTRGPGYGPTGSRGMNLLYTGTYTGSDPSAALWNYTIRTWFGENQHFEFGTGTTNRLKTVEHYTQVGKIIDHAG